MDKAAIIYSRFNSRRLPGKALLPLADRSLLETVIYNLKGGDWEIILATSDEKSDDVLADVAHNNSIHLFRGSLNNVAKRTIDCINFFGIKKFARINGDSPFINRGLITTGFTELNTKNVNFVTNLWPRTFPYGYSLEVFNADFFSRSVEYFSDSEMENISSYFYRNIEKCSYYNVYSTIKYSQQIILTVDDDEGYKKIKCLFDLNPGISNHSLEEIVNVYYSC